MGAGGFEPPKLKAADLQSVPIGHSGTRPYSFLCPLPDDLFSLSELSRFVNSYFDISQEKDTLSDFADPRAKAVCGTSPWAA